MNDELYWEIVEAKRAHRQWVSRALLLLERGQVNEEMVPTNETECRFGKIYYGNAQRYNHSPAFQEIGAIHTKVHEKYAEIFSLLFHKEDISFFAKLLGKSSSASPEKVKQAKSKYYELSELSHQLSDLLDKLLEQVKNNKL